MTKNPETNSQYSPPPRAAWNVPEFCQAHDISRAFLYKLWKAGSGPRVLKVGRRTLITPEAGAEWLAGMEVQRGEGA